MLSPTLYITYTSDIPLPNPPSKLSSFADDNIQQSISQSPRPRVLALRTSREVRGVNAYERRKKLSSNPRKTYMLSVARTKPKAVYNNGRRLPHSSQIKILGLRLSRCGYAPQVTHNIQKARGVIATLRRFRMVPWRIKLKLYKTLVRPVLEYPAIPLHLATHSPMARIQAVQNAAIMWICGTSFRDPNRPRLQVLHNMLRLEPINQRLYRLARRVWEKLANDADPNYLEALTMTQLPTRRHTTADPLRWWPSSYHYAHRQRPAALYHG